MGSGGSRCVSDLINACVCSDAFMDFTNGILSVTGINATGHIFASYPGRHLTVLGGFVDQVSLDQSGYPRLTHIDPLSVSTQNHTDPL